MGAASEVSMPRGAALFTNTPQRLHRAALDFADGLATAECTTLRGVDTAGTL